MRPDAPRSARHERGGSRRAPASSAASSLGPSRHAIRTSRGSCADAGRDEPDASGTDKMKECDVDAFSAASVSSSARPRRRRRIDTRAVALAPPTVGVAEPAKSSRRRDPRRGPARRSGLATRRDDSAAPQPATMRRGELPSPLGRRSVNRSRRARDRRTPDTPNLFIGRAATRIITSRRGFGAVLRFAPFYRHLSGQLLLEAAPGAGLRRFSPSPVLALIAGLTDRRRAIVSFGDSLTAAGLVEAGRRRRPRARVRALVRRVQPRLRGATRQGGGAPTFPARCLPVTVLLGTNDAALADVEPSAHVPLEEYAENLAAIVEHVKRRAARVVLTERMRRDRREDGEHARACTASSVFHRKRSQGNTRLRRSRANRRRGRERPLRRPVRHHPRRHAPPEDASSGGMGDCTATLTVQHGVSAPQCRLEEIAALGLGGARRSMLRSEASTARRREGSTPCSGRRDAAVGAFDDLRTASRSSRGRRPSRGRGTLLNIARVFPAAARGGPHGRRGLARASRARDGVRGERRSWAKHARWAASSHSPRPAVFRDGGESAPACSLPCCSGGKVVARIVH